MWFFLNVTFSSFFSFFLLRQTFKVLSIILLVIVFRQKTECASIKLVWFAPLLKKCVDFLHLFEKMEYLVSSMQFFPTLCHPDYTEKCKEYSLLWSLLLYHGKKFLQSSAMPPPQLLLSDHNPPKKGWEIRMWKLVTMHNAISAVVFKFVDYYGVMDELCKYTIIGKFLRTQPKIERVKSVFA